MSSPVLEEIDLKPKTIPISFMHLSEGYSTWKNSETLTTDLVGAINHSVVIRGFLYKKMQNDESVWIVASEPNLKSCCVGNSAKKNLQLIVSGDLPLDPPKTAVNLQGILQFTHEGNHHSSFTLSDASIQSERALNSFFWVLAMIILVSFVLHRLKTK